MAQGELGASEGVIAEVKAEDTLPTLKGAKNESNPCERPSKTSEHDVSQRRNRKRLVNYKWRKLQFEQYDTEGLRVESMPILNHTVNGRVVLPEGYTITKVPAYASFEGEEPIDRTLHSYIRDLLRKPKSQTEVSVNIAQDYSFLKAAVALGQALYAISTIYQTRGTQIEQFGYVAYGFTVLPYAFMSSVNLISNIVCPEYAAIFIVENEELSTLRRDLEAENRSSELIIEGAVGRLSARTEEKMRMDVKARTVNRLPAIGWQIAMIVTGLAVYLAVVGGLTGFSKGHSTHAQRVWIMTWYCFGVLLGPYLKVIMDGLVITPLDAAESSKTSTSISFVLVILLYATPAIGGFVVVGQEIRQYGICERI